MPTLTNMAAFLSPYTTSLTNGGLLPTTNYLRDGQSSSTGGGTFIPGGPNYLDGQDPTGSVLQGDTLQQLNSNPAISQLAPVSSKIEGERHIGQHVGIDNLARIYALNGDVAEQPNVSQGMIVP